VTSKQEGGERCYRYENLYLDVRRLRRSGPGERYQLGHRADEIPFLQQGKIDALFAGVPVNLEMRQKGIGHVLVSTTTDKPWSQYSCCLVASTKEFVRKSPVATKRALRALLKGVDLCASDPSRAARFWADKKLGNYELAVQVLRELPFAKRD